MTDPIGAANAVIGIGQALGIGAGAQDERQREQQEKLQKIAIEGSKDLTDYNYDKELAMWKATNYSAQMNEAEKAGLSVSWLMGKGGGAGGQISNAGMSVSPGHAADAAATQQAKTQSMLAAAQLANINADTELKQANADNVGQNTKNAGLEEKFNATRNEIQSRTKEDQISAIISAANKLMHEENIAGTNQVISENTRIDQETKIKAEAYGAIIQNAATEQGIQLDKARIQEIANNIKVSLQNVDLNRKGLEVSEENMKRLTEAMLWGAGINATGNIVKGILDVKKLGKGSTKTTTRIDKDGNVSETYENYIRK